MFPKMHWCEYALVYAVGIFMIEVLSGGGVSRLTIEIMHLF